jgi:hypothetical protein
MSLVSKLELTAAEIDEIMIALCERDVALRDSVDACGDLPVIRNQHQARRDAVASAYDKIRLVASQEAEIRYRAEHDIPVSSIDHGNNRYSFTGKRGLSRKTGEKTYEYASCGDRSRLWANIRAEVVEVA